MWRRLQLVGLEAGDDNAQWARAFDAYRAHLGKICARLGTRGYNFCPDAHVHDAELLDAGIFDGGRVASRGTRPWQALMAYPMRVELTILDALDEHVGHLVYSSIRTVLTGFPPKIRCSLEGLAALMTWDITN